MPKGMQTRLGMMHETKGCVGKALSLHLFHTTDLAACALHRTATASYGSSRPSSFSFSKYLLCATASNTVADLERGFSHSCAKHSPKI